MLRCAGQAWFPRSIHEYLRNSLANCFSFPAVKESSRAWNCFPWFMYARWESSCSITKSARCPGSLTRFMFRFMFFFTEQLPQFDLLSFILTERYLNAGCIPDRAASLGTSVLRAILRNISLSGSGFNSSAFSCEESPHSSGIRISGIGRAAFAVFSRYF